MNASKSNRTTWCIYREKWTWKLSLLQLLNWTIASTTKISVNSSKTLALSLFAYFKKLITLFWIDSLRCTTTYLPRPRNQKSRRAEKDLERYCRKEDVVCVTWVSGKKPIWPFIELNTGAKTIRLNNRRALCFNMHDMTSFQGSPHLTNCKQTAAWPTMIKIKRGMSWLQPHHSQPPHQRHLNSHLNKPFLPCAQLWDQRTRISHASPAKSKLSKIFFNPPLNSSRCFRCPHKKSSIEFMSSLLLQGNQDDNAMESSKCSNMLECNIQTLLNPFLIHHTK